MPSRPASRAGPIAPHSASEPPAAKQAASLTASTKDSPQNLLTTGEKTGWNETAPYAEAVEISHRLERASRFVKVMDIGTTPEGRTMIALVISKDRAFTPEAAAQRLNLNRDYMKADTPEMRAWLRAFNTWMPDFLIDNHVTDGSDMQYDVTWDMARNQDIAEPAGDWVREKYVPELDKRMAADGHLVAPYGALRNRQFFMEVFSPRYSHLYSAVQNRPSLLVETHSLKAARTRAWANYDIMRHTFDIITADAESLRKAVRDADRAIESRAGDRGRSEHRKSDRASHPRPGNQGSLQNRRNRSSLANSGRESATQRSIQRCRRFSDLPQCRLWRSQRQWHIPHAERQPQRGSSPCLWVAR